MNHPVCYVSTMLLRHCHLPMLLFLAAFSAMAGTVAVPAAPVSPCSDTETVTNAAVRPSLMQRARTFSGDIALYATPSNALEVAFGTSRNGDGILLPGDETFSIGLLTLKHDNQLDISILHAFSPDVEFSNISFEIREPGFSGWQPISGNTWTARIAGTFEVRGHAMADGRDVDVGPVVMQVRFPSETEMMANPAIQSHAASLWAQTLALCTPTNRHEVGCWILLDTSSDTYSFTTTTPGFPTPNDADSGIDLLPKPPDSPVFPHLSHGSAVYTVGTLHTHTPTVYRTGGPRPTGPSNDDRSASTTLSMPGLVYDYSDTANYPGQVPMGHPMGSGAQLYPTGVQQRSPHQ